MFAVLRIFTGLLFVVSGGEKLIWPYQNFLYVLQSYELLPAGMDMIVARVFPWVEFITGILLVIGLWVPQAVRIAWTMFAVFILTIAQALVRHLPIDECGCFGQLISLKPQHTLIMDSVFFLLLWTSLKNIGKTQQWSMDKAFQKS